MEKSLQLLLVFLGLLAVVYLIQLCIGRGLGQVLVAWTRRAHQIDAEFHHDLSLATEAVEGIAEMPDTEALERATRLLRDRNRFVCSESEGPLPDEYARRLAPGASDLFSRYCSIATTGGEMLIGMEMFRNTTSPEMLEIGGTEDEAVCLMSSSEVIYRRNDASRDLEPVADTIYHWLLIVDATFNEPSTPE